MTKHKVKVYTTPICPWCHRAMEFLKENKIDFEQIDIAENEAAAQEMIDKSGQMGVPVVDIDGAIIVGFNEPAIKKALGLK